MNLNPKRKLFVYGTLMIPEIFKKVTGREPDFQHGKLRNYRRISLQNRYYPGLIYEQDDSTEGFLVIINDEREWNILVQYEGSEYKLNEVEVEMQNSSKEKAWVFTLNENYHCIAIDETWYLHKFIECNLQQYLDDVNFW